MNWRIPSHYRDPLAVAALILGVLSIPFIAIAVAHLFVLLRWLIRRLFG